MTSSVPQPTFGPTGFIAPSEPDVLAGVQADMNAAFGGNLNPALETPQGQLASSLTALVGEKNALFLQYTNGVDPAFATGRMQDAIGRIYFLERNPATSTTVIGTCAGLAGVVIPAGTLTQSTDGNLYASTTIATIGVGGTVDVVFQCQTTGPIACPTGTLTTIYRAIPGWDSVTNAADGTPGRNVETPAEFEERRRASVALNARNTLQSMRANVLDVENVTDAYVISNDTAAGVAVGGITLAAYATYVAVLGGVGQDVAEAVWRKKPPGGPMYTTGATAYVVEDESPDLTPPYPTYTIYIKTPAAVPIYIDVEITDTDAVPSDAQEQVRTAVVSAFSGGDGGSRARIGGTLYALRFAAPIAALGAWATNIISIKIGIAASPTGDTVTVDIDEYPSISSANINLTLV